MTEAGRCQVVQLTPAGRGAIATLLVQGPKAAEHVNDFFQPAGRLPATELPLGKIAFGRWSADAGPGEELVVCRTRPDTFEIHCHGGTAAVAAIICSLTGRGCDQVGWRDYAIDSSDDPISAEARIALAHARTQRTAGILLDQFGGALRRALRSIEEDLLAENIEQAHSSLLQLQQSANVGLHLTEPFRVVMAGPPNVGKSSLINAILGYARAIVFDQPGTTRDVLTTLTALDGWPVELIDTAGLRDSSNDIERQGVGRAKAAAEQADLVVLVRDVSGPPAAEYAVDRKAISDNTLVVGNKCDLPLDTQAETQVDLLVSAATGENMSQLQSAITSRLVPSPPNARDPVPFTSRQFEMIDEAIQALDRADLEAALAAIRTVFSPLPRGS